MALQIAAALREWRTRLWGTLSGRRPDQELEDELRLHLELVAADEVRRSGRPAVEAHRAAAIHLGGVTQSLEALRDQRGLPWLDDLLRDLRHTLRSLRRTPVFTVVAVLTLGLGVGSNTALFGLVDTMLLKALPVRDPESLVGIALQTEPDLRSGGRETQDDLSYPLFAEFQARNRTLSALVASMSDRMNTRIPPSQDAEPLTVSLVSANFFETLGVRAAVGRPLTAGDDVPPGAHPVAVLSDRFWRNRFHADQGVLGTTVEVHRVALTVVGVAPPGFFGAVVGEMPDLWVPATLQPQLLPPQNNLEQVGVDWLRVIARLRPEATRAQAEADLTLALQQIRQDWTGLSKARGLPVSPNVIVSAAATGLSELRQRFAWPLQILMAIAGLVLVVACVNLANLLLARAAAREREMATRAAIGASRTRLAKQLIVEHGVLALLGGAAGVLLAYWSTAPLVAMLTDYTGAPPLVLRVDWRLLLFAALTAAATGVLFGVIPTLRTLRSADVSRPQGMTGAVRGRFGKILVVSQIALSLVLVVAAALFVQTVRNLRIVDAGFDREHVLLAQVDSRPTGVKGPELVAMFQRMRTELAALPGVRSVSYSAIGLMQGRSRVCCFGVTDYTPAEGERMAIRTNDVSPGYFANVGMTVQAGRDFADSDGQAAVRPLVVNDAFVRQYVKAGAAVGRSFWFDRAKPMEIVGVVRDAHYDALRTAAVPLVFMPIRDNSPLQSIEVRASGDPLLLIPAVRRLIAASHPLMRVRDVMTVDQLLESSFAQELLLAKAAGLFGALALAIAALGTYGLMVFLVTRRTPEIGLRMALGASRAFVLHQICRESALLVIGGLLCGLPLALATAQVIRNQLFGVAPTDPASLIGASALMAVMALLAGLLPARRATRINPLIALRSE